MDTAVIPGTLGGLSSIAPTARLERAEYPVVTKIMRSLASLSYPRAMLRLIAPLLVALWLCAGPARADWMNLTGAETAPNIAEITIEDDRVRLVLEIYIGDLDTFRDLVPDDWLQDAAADRPELRERLPRSAWLFSNA